MNADWPIEAVLAEFPAVGRPDHIESLGTAGGFSGAQFWRFSRGTTLWCLRRWPAEHPTPSRLRFIHAVLCMAASGGCRFVPAPQTTCSGATFVDCAGHLWELSRWMPGRADFHDCPTASRLQAACRALAQFHEAVAAFDARPFDEATPPTFDVSEPRPVQPPDGDRPLQTPAPQPAERATCAAAAEPAALPGGAGRCGRAPGLVARLGEVQSWLGGELDRLQQSLDPRRFPQLAAAGQEIVARVRRAAAALRDELREAVEVPVALQPCIRDIWHDHVLFTGDDVTGIVDYGALRVDSVAADLARLLGSFVEDDRDAWNVGLVAYQSVRPLTAQESMLLYAYDRANVLLSGLHWLQWVFCRGYTFADRRCVLQRVETNLRRLRRLTEP
jgi:homoserine kinase type II